ncbi:MAG: hypothetical protein UV70_C0008G0014 [Parcubacteria group bacterium GW2011_GWA2_43_13]|nr:MAG: hypothetical protein UV70_C0008G0014 [Parcubacteria group bacterium GW2011_GWA2_43_13]
MVKKMGRLKKREYMKIIFDPPLTERVQYFLKRCGYREILDRKSGRRSWVRPLNRSGHYPRFHCHIADDRAVSHIIDVHYDVLRPLHRKESSASENAGPVLEQEIERIQALGQPRREGGKTAVSTTEEKKISWWEKLFFGG